MSYPPTQFVTSRNMAIYDSNQQISMWEDSFKSDSSPNTGGSTIVEADGKLDYRVSILDYVSWLKDLGLCGSYWCSKFTCLIILVQSEDVSHRTLGAPKKFDQEANKSNDKVSRLCSWWLETVFFFFFTLFSVRTY